MAHHKHSASMMVPKSEWTPAQKRHVAVQSKKIDALRKREQKMDERHQSYLKRQSEGKLTKKDFNNAYDRVNQALIEYSRGNIELPIPNIK